MNEIQRVVFEGDEIESFEQDGEIYVGLTSMCRALGVDAYQQLKRLRKQAWFQGAITTVAPSAGGPQLTYFIPLKVVPMWLATMSASRVSEQARPKVVKFQLHVCDVLRKHFVDRHPVALPAPANDIAIEKAKLIVQLVDRLPWVSDEMKAPYVADALGVLTGRTTTMLLPVIGSGVFKSPSEIAREEGTNQYAVGRVISELGLRGGQHSRTVMNKAANTDKNVPSYIYDEEAVAMIKNALRKKAG